MSINTSSNSVNRYMNDAWPWNSEIKNLSGTFDKHKDRMSKYGNWINSDDILAKNALFNITVLSRIMIRRPFLGNVVIQIYTFMYRLDQLVNSMFDVLIKYRTSLGDIMQLRSRRCSLITINSGILKKNGLNVLTYQLKLSAF